MKILILEDDENRMEIFKRNLIGHSITITEKSKEAIEYLKNNKYDYLYLDHDLGGKVMVASGENTGYEVAKWLEENPDRKPDHIILHSFNPVGSDNMKKALPEAIQLPGAWVYPINED